jgi:hypothetical protein
LSTNKRDIVETEKGGIRRAAHGQGGIDETLADLRWWGKWLTISEHIKASLKGKA